MPLGREADERVFELPSSDATINYYIKKWARGAGVSKSLSYHCIRHTFATMMLTLGADVYTTSKLLGHSPTLAKSKIIRTFALLIPDSP